MTMLRHIPVTMLGEVKLGQEGAALASTAKEMACHNGGACGSGGGSRSGRQLSQAQRRWRRQATPPAQSPAKAKAKGPSRVHPTSPHLKR